MPLATRTLLISIGLLLTGHGIQLTLLPLYANFLGWSKEIISLTGASYFAGFMFGSLVIPRLLTKAGFIRVFLTFSALMAIVILSLGMFQNVFAWLILRFLTGLSIVAVYLTAESWLNASAVAKHRGRILSYYALVSLLGVGLGQTLAGLLSFEDLLQVCAIIMLLSLFPIGLFCSEEPASPEFVRARWADLNEIPTFVVIAIVLSAIMCGSIWSVAPLFGQERGLNNWEISLMMNAIVFGGVLFQIPLGILSDKYDRKMVLSIVVLGCLLAVAAIPSAEDMAFLGLCFVFGGLSLTQYVLCAAFANEQSTLSKVKTASLVLMLNGTGSIAGPLFVALISIHMDNALLIVCGSSMILLLITSSCMRGTTPRATILPLPRRYRRRTIHKDQSLAA